MLNALETLRRRSRAARASRDAGITLTELIVTSTLMSVVGALALTALVGTSDTSTRTTEAGLTTASARTTVAAWTNLLQVAVIPDPAAPTARNLVLTPTSISFNAQLDNLPSCSTSCDTGAPTAVTLQRRTATGDGAPAVQLVETLSRAGTSNSRVLVSSGVSTDCLFRAYTYSGADLGCAPLSAADSGTVGRVDMAFSLTPASGTVQQFRSSVKLPGAS